MGFVRNYMGGSLIVAVLLSGGTYDREDFSQSENLTRSVFLCTLWPVVVAVAFGLASAMQVGK